MSSKRITQVSVVGGMLVSLWSLAAVVSGLAQVNWQVSELLRQYMTAIGVIREFHTFVDFYTHIKGIEYVICLAFLVGFPMFFRFLNKSTAEQESA
ncbi:MAG: hypothetical protein AB1568_06070 [Thermodesulfobacteriota bacterium]